MDLEVRELRYFIAVAEEASFTRAARRLQMSQPPLSAAIKSLEGWLGTALFERSSRHVRLTPAGEALLADARRIVAEVDAAVSHAREVGYAAEAILDVGFRPSTSVPLLNPTIAEFRRAVPGAEVRLHHIEWVDQVGGLLEKRVEVSFVLEPLSHPEITVTTVHTAPRVAAVASDHPLADRRSVSIADLAPYPVAYPTGAPPEWADFWTASPRPIEKGVTRPGVPVSTSDESMSVIVTGGVAISIATVSALYQSFDIRFVPIYDIEPARIGVAWLTRNNDPLVREFISTAKRVSADRVQGSGEQPPEAAVAQNTSA
jgi:DNA-binding transcriptional LysR family regulator